jgi:hypothetical protein
MKDPVVTILDCGNGIGHLYYASNLA